LLSHVNAISSPDVKIDILNIVGRVSDPVKAQFLLPMIQDLVQDLPPKEQAARKYGARLEEVTALALSSFDNSISDDLNKPDGTLWPVFISSLEHCFQPSMIGRLYLS
jgi:U3 small nucleolar RNA-associated protein 10